MPLPYIVDGKQLGYSKCGKTYIFAEKESNSKLHGNYELIRTKIEERYLTDTRIPIGTIDFKDVINIKEDKINDE